MCDVSLRSHAGATGTKLNLSGLLRTVPLFFIQLLGVYGIPFVKKKTEVDQ